MNETEESKETDAFTGNSSPKKQLSQSMMNLKKTNKILLIALIVLVLVIIGLIIAFCIVAFLSTESDDEQQKEAGVCYTDECMNTAKYLYNNMDLSVDPCEDFYNYTCRGWGTHHPRPADALSWGVNSLVADDLQNKIIQMLEKEEKETEIPKSIAKAKRFYKSCTRTSDRHEYGMEELTKVIRKIGGFPIINETWTEDNYNFEDAYIYCDAHLNAIQVFFKYKIERELMESKQRFIDLKMSATSFIADSLKVDYEEERSTKEDVMNKEIKFRKLFKKRVKELNSKLSETQIDDDIDKFIDFEKKLSKLASETLVEDEGEQSAGHTIKEMNEKYKYIDWLKIFSNIFKTANVTITDDEIVYNEHPHYFTKIGEFIHNTPKRTIANYIGYAVIDGFGAKTVYSFDGDKKVDDSELKKSCASATEKFFKVALNYWFVKNYLGDNTIDELNGFMKELKAALTLTLQNNEWMDDKTKLEAQMKLNNMIEYIASPSDIKSDEELDAFYRHTGFISAENYVKNFKKMSKWIKYDTLLSLRETDDKKVKRPSTVNAFYSPGENKIQILTGFLTPPNLYPHAPIAVNMAAIGSTIGHEITHGFDTTGSKFDYKGIYRDWWDKKTTKRYKGKVDCFIKQYSDFVEPTTGLKINGEKTVGENIADNGALHQAYQAYKMYAAVKDSANDLKLPLGMQQFTKDQLFFIAYANTYCNNHAKYFNAYLMKYDEHPPDVSRVVIPLQNADEFAKAFNCRKGSKMNPENKCVLW